MDMLDDPVTRYVLVAIAILAIVPVVKDWFEYSKSRKDLSIAESQAFNVPLRADQTGGVDQTDVKKRRAEENITVGRLFNLYSKQIESYQVQTRSRATWSFLASLVAMAVGLYFVYWGGKVMLGGDDGARLAAGGVMSGIGGAVSAYISKTFLEVHRLSLNQLNRYFQQPVINDHIVMAQRLADGILDQESKKRAYERLVDSVLGLIARYGVEETRRVADLEGESRPAKTTKKD